MHETPQSSRESIRDGLKIRKDKLDQLQLNIQEALRYFPNGWATF